MLVNDKLKIQATERNSFCLGTYNVRSWGGRSNDTSDCWVTNASNTARLATQADIDILGVQECRIPGVNRIQIVTENGPWTLLHSGHGTKKKFINGVGLLLNRRATKAMIGYHGINERIICANFRIRNSKNMFIVCTYAPTEVAEPINKDEFYESLNEAMKFKRADEIPHVIGDFNARICYRNALSPQVGRNAIGTRTTNNDQDSSISVARTA